MNDVVLIKGNKHGLSIWLSPDAVFEDIEKTLVTKLEDGRKFFGNSKVSIEFTGYKLNKVQQESILDNIHKYTDMNIYCVLDESVLSDKAIIKSDVDSTNKKVQLQPVLPKEVAVFHQGTLRSGQILDVNTGIIIIGDVNPGAKVTAKGNIVIIGSLKGYAYAGSSGSNKAFVFALNMRPTQIRINQVIARSPDKVSKKKTEPQLAFLEDGRIVIDEIHNTLYKDFDILN